MVCVSALVKR